ncbi:hypothetical protein [Sinorhizobium psoraleae]|uniref:Uncharacterized protein n=1 Tax=Sinorhizobium psoraleae TaxID=520838 RepID=A0ABT4KMV7_9HYPH|nr:hypothetical protein [Sinorhizobium psoraleae]MCZ4093295.1 hypothetical protein [Sinorhizobium psoraleae]
MSERELEAPEEIDLLVIGAGAGGMTAALKDALDGLSVPALRVPRIIIGYC